MGYSSQSKADISARIFQFQILVSVAFSPTRPMPTKFDRTVKPEGRLIGLLLISTIILILCFEYPSSEAVYVLMCLFLDAFPWMIPIESTVKHSLLSGKSLEMTLAVDNLRYFYHQSEDWYLGKDATRMIQPENASASDGKSEVSEATSFEYFHQLCGAKLLFTELEVKYQKKSCLIDYVCKMYDLLVGVSVTRVYGYYGKPMPTKKIKKLLEGKLIGIQHAQAAAVNPWNKSVLHIWTESIVYANTIASIIKTKCIAQEVILIITVANGEDDMFKNIYLGWLAI